MTAGNWLGRLRQAWIVHWPSRLAGIWSAATLPATIFYLFVNARIHPAYGFTWRKRFLLDL